MAKPLNTLAQRALILPEVRLDIDSRGVRDQPCESLDGPQWIHPKTEWPGFHELCESSGAELRDPVDSRAIARARHLNTSPVDTRSASNYRKPDRRQLS